MGKDVWLGLEKMKHGKLFAVAFLLATFLGTADVEARECVTHQPDAETTARMFDMSLSIRNALDALSPDVKVVILARGGQDLSRFGLIYSHLAFALRDSDGQWRVVHELNVCKTDHSDLYREGLVNFVGESVLRADVLVVVPQMTLRDRLQKLLASEDDTARLLHEPRYSLVAYPFSTRYQNSNQWVLEMLAAAMMPAHDRPVSRDEVQIWLRKAGYTPSTLHIKLHERLAARIWVDNANTVDHPASERLSGDYSVVTVDSVVNFMRSAAWLDRVFTVSRSQSGTGKLANGDINE